MPDDAVLPVDAVLPIYGCSVGRCATGPSCSNLREQFDAVPTVSEAVFEHHTPEAASCRMWLPVALRRDARTHGTRQLRKYLTMMLCLNHPETSPFVGSQREAIH